jgi:hypothetical protein
VTVVPKVTERTEDGAAFQEQRKRAGANTMTEQDEKQWRELCNEAMDENNPNKLLSVFLALDRAMAREERLASVASRREASESTLSPRPFGVHKVKV